MVILYIKDIERKLILVKDLDYISDSIKKAEQDIKAGKELKHSLELKIALLRGQYNQKIENLKTLGITDIKNAEKELELKKEQLLEDLNKLKEQIPSDLIEKYKNIDFSNENVDSISKLE